MKRIGLFCVIMLACCLCASESRAGLILETVENNFNFDGKGDWTSLGPGASGLSVGRPFTQEVVGIAGLDMTVSQTTGSFLRMDQPPAIGLFFWRGDFAPSEVLLWTLDSTLPVSFEFDAAIYGFGIQVEPAGGPLNYVATLEVFDGMISLGSFDVASTANKAGDDSAAFIGITSDSKNITKAVLSVSLPVGTLDSFAFNAPRIQNQDPVVIPEPSTIVICIVTFVFASFVMWRFRKVEVSVDHV